jgi:hypothetical protein
MCDINTSKEIKRLCNIGSVEIEISELLGKKMCGPNCRFRIFGDQFSGNTCILFNKKLFGQDRCFECINSNLTKI